MARRIRERHAHILEHEFFLEAAKAGKQRLLRCCGSLLRGRLHLTGSFRQEYLLRTLVVRMLAADDKAVALHSGERIGHGCLLDVEPVEKLSLRQPFLGP